MIISKKDYINYLNEDSLNFAAVSGRNGILHYLKHRIGSSPISDQSRIWSYIKTLRQCEYYYNKSKFHPLALYYLHRLRSLSRITGFQIPLNTIGKGITIWHWGPIVINANARVGDYCVFEPGITIGHKDIGGMAPKIGDYVTICSGARIIGDITIGDDVYIAPNCVVTKSIPPHSIVVGVPARIIKTRTDMKSEWVTVKKY